VIKVTGAESDHPAGHSRRSLVLNRLPHRGDTPIRT
jgi:hypothetical protein